uniref:Uncharacterized protein n=1 Tax=Candidatus Kentrum sp. FW TaxID=2126338 RepID=A0A450U2R8_9GAMM|nr:MAG: hypothetical protein BECKFW1821C_GA0114237_112211 [Candidatus Kentron sp. FW]
MNGKSANMTPSSITPNRHGECLTTPSRKEWKRGNGKAPGKKPGRSRGCSSAKDYPPGRSPRQWAYPSPSKNVLGFLVPTLARGNGVSRGHRRLLGSPSSEASSAYSNATTFQRIGQKTIGQFRFEPGGFGRHQQSGVGDGQEFGDPGGIEGKSGRHLSMVYLTL